MTKTQRAPILNNTFYLNLFILKSRARANIKRIAHGKASNGMDR